MRKMGPLSADHPLVGKDECPGCHELFSAGDYVTLLVVGPGGDPEARARAREGRPYSASAVPVHWACATGDEFVRRMVP